MKLNFQDNLNTATHSTFKVNLTLYLTFLDQVFWKNIEVMSDSCHLDRASNDEFCVECLF